MKNRLLRDREASGSERCLGGRWADRRNFGGWTDIGDEREGDSISSASRVSVLDDKVDGNCLCS